MRTVKQTSSFKRDLKREAKGAHRVALARDFVKIVETLANDQPLPEMLRDHALAGDWKDHRDCHIKPDLVLIYRKPNGTVLQLVRLGSHSQLGLQWVFQTNVTSDSGIVTGQRGNPFARHPVKVMDRHGLRPRDDEIIVTPA